MSAKEYFDIAAATWDQKFLTPNLSSFVKKLVSQFGVKTGQKILDVGTGTGILIPHLVKAIGPSGTVTAIDYSEKMAQICKTKHSHIKNVKIKVRNIEDNTFPAETFDGVICFGVFPHLKDKQKSLRNINYCLKPGGKLIIAHALSSEELKVHHNKVSKHVENASIPNRTEMIKLLEQNGFTNISIQDKPGCYLCMSHKL